jgi:spore maturation protein CgeB
MNRLFNRSRIVLNLHLSDLPNTETRIAEVLGAGAFLLTEGLSSPGLIEDGKHAVAFPIGDVEALLSKLTYYLEHEQERETIAREGHRYVYEHHTYAHRVKEIFDQIERRTEKRFTCRIPSKGQTLPAESLESFDDSGDKDLSNVAPLHARRASPGKTHPAAAVERRKLRIFAAFAHANWEDQNLMPALQAFGDVIRFRWNSDVQYREDWHQKGKITLSREILEAVRAIHREKPIDIFFSYLSGRTVFPGIIRSIGALGIPTLNISLDDKMKFYGALEPTGFAGVVDIANAYTLCWTSTETALRQYETVGARALCLPEGADPGVYRRIPGLNHDMDVSFIGQCYGQRPQIIEYLKGKGIRVQAFGKGWPSGEISVETMVEIYNRSRVNLGFSAVGDTADVCCLKGRDFEVPMSGGLYLTQHHSELESVYEIGEEILCYRDMDDLVEKIRFCLDRPDKAGELREAGYRRAIGEHTWKMRFDHVFRIMGLLPEEEKPARGFDVFQQKDCRAAVSGTQQ